jgi:hypothetical protein
LRNTPIDGNLKEVSIGLGIIMETLKDRWQTLWQLLVDVDLSISGRRQRSSGGADEADGISLSSQLRYNQSMARNLPANLKVDRRAFSVGSLTEPSDEKAYWLARTPSERLQQVEILRRINYGYRATVRLQRVLEITERERR